MNLEDNLQIKRKLLEGALLIYPTDTVYGLGAVIDNEESLKNLWS